MFKQQLTRCTNLPITRFKFTGSPPFRQLIAIGSTDQAGAFFGQVAAPANVCALSAGYEEVRTLDLTTGVIAMNGKRMPTIAILTGVLTVAGGWAISAQDKYTLKVPNGLAFSEFRGYEAWQFVSISQDTNLNLMSATLANPVAIEAYLAGVPSNGKPFPDRRQAGEDPLEPG